MKVSEAFPRPVGGQQLAVEVARYLLASDGAVSVMATCSTGGCVRGPVDLKASSDPMDQLARLIQGPPRLRRCIYLVAEFSGSPLERVEVAVHRTWTMTRIIGDDRRVVEGERHALLRELRALRRSVELGRLVTVTVASAGGVVGIVEILRH